MRFQEDEERGRLFVNRSTLASNLTDKGENSCETYESKHMAASSSVTTPREIKSGPSVKFPAGRPVFSSPFHLFVDGISPIPSFAYPP